MSIERKQYDAETAIEQAIDAVRNVCRECTQNTCEGCEYRWVVAGIKFFDDDYKNGYNRAYTGKDAAAIKAMLEQRD